MIYGVNLLLSVASHSSTRPARVTMFVRLHRTRLIALEYSRCSAAGEPKWWVHAVSKSQNARDILDLPS
jgi:hypothetical protein